MQENQEKKRSTRARLRYSKTVSYDIESETCPRCHSSSLFDLDTSLDCLNCSLEFNKSELSIYDPENMLAEEEKSNIVALLIRFCLEDIEHSRN
ncbi:MAG: hypothetical protein JW891_06255 [Candidatus Lokiarchaeota archaeon]|nr:hypothetical protein [Candidatus Lokiarchaeota archaeon]